MSDKNYLDFIKAQCKIFAEEDRKLVDSLFKSTRKKPNFRKEVQGQRVHEPEEAAITLTATQEKAMGVLLSGENVFLSGKAGTGKSLLTRVFIHKSMKAGKNVLVCAPTGIAALNIGGATLHRTFAVPTELFSSSSECESKKCLEVIDKADIILIDEISMCRIDLFRFVANTIISSQDRTRRKKQIVVVGDFFQLPPVLRSEDKRHFKKLYGSKLYAFESVLWKDLNFVYVELEEVIRQKDGKLMQALNNIREGIPDLTLFKEYEDDNPDAIAICGRNDEAYALNRQQLRKLGKTCVYEAHSWGINDNAPTEYQLELAVGARVILLANDDNGRWANGTLAVVKALFPEKIMISVGGKKYELGYHTWETKEYHLRRRFGGRYMVETDVVGSFSQLPVKLAYAITIHRSQGQTYESVNIHPEGIFAEGQLYVALSRGRTLDGIRIVGHLTEKQLKVSPKVIDFYKSLKGVDFNMLLTTTCARGGQESVKSKVDFNKPNPCEVVERGGQETVKKSASKKSFSTYKGKATRNRIFDLMKSNPYITSLQLANTLNINRSAVQKHLTKLSAGGWIRRSGSKKAGRWEVFDAVEM